MANVIRQRARRKRPPPPPAPRAGASALAIYHSASGPGMAVCPIWAEPGAKPRAAPPLPAPDLEAARQLVPPKFTREDPTPGDKADNPRLIEVWYAPR